MCGSLLDEAPEICCAKTHHTSLSITAFVCMFDSGTATRHSQKVKRSILRRHSWYRVEQRTQAPLAHHEHEQRHTRVPVSPPPQMEISTPPRSEIRDIPRHSVSDPAQDQRRSLHMHAGCAVRRITYVTVSPMHIACRIQERRENGSISIARLPGSARRQHRWIVESEPHHHRQYPTPSSRYSRHGPFVLGCHVPMLQSGPPALQLSPPPPCSSKFPLHQLHRSLSPDIPHPATTLR